MKASGIQIIGTQRSGSNLLRVILDQSPEIASPHPPHILVTFVPLLALYGSLADDANYKTLVNDVVAYVNANPVPWEGVQLNADEIYGQSEVNSLFELNRLIYEKAAESKQAKYWCCKSMNNVYFADELEAQKDKLKYIYLYRDGRDVALSFQKAVVGDKHIYHIARQWKKDQDACLALAKQVPAARFFSLNYENLISKPEEMVRELCAFLDIDYSDNMLQYYTSKTSKITAASGEMWSNLEKPIMTDNTNKFLKEFKGNELELFELIAGDTLTVLGYQLYARQLNRDLLSPHLIAGYDNENIEQKKYVLNNARPSDLDKRAAQEGIVRRIKQKLAL
ncbi:sulfotransferase family protein [Mucilaginibacter sp. FT3.2]|uniref:sulfotransferase family protein n=1 Tax=Mucilaginibacter sp. FT3.2 TaxID=2723090 RepID=UPI001620B3DA|nr:sulfotransferase [Mucilaginibacter sp. FT3.2]MBB6229807.1 hypothetical protein [Mucilaginibacter sp. FT3.2]